MHKVPGVLHSHAHGLTMADTSESARNAGQAFTHACTQRCGNHFSPVSFEIAPLQSAHENLLPWWWIITHPSKCVLTGQDIAWSSTVLSAKTVLLRLQTNLLSNMTSQLQMLGRNTSRWVCSEPYDLIRNWMVTLKCMVKWLRIFPGSTGSSSPYTMGSTVTNWQLTALLTIQ